MKLNNFVARGRLRLWRKMTPSFSFTVGDAKLRVSARNTKPIEILNWKYGWKSSLIKRLLEIEEGAVIDVGANVGQTLVEFCATGVDRPYFGFEPNPPAFWSLCTLASENKLSNCTILPIGLSDKTAVLSLYSFPSDCVTDDTAADNGASLLSDLRPSRQLRRTVVPCYRFDDVRNDLGLDAIGVIKIDVEGAELQTLRGMSKSLQELRPPVICEVLLNSPDADREAYEDRLNSLAGLLAELGYKIFHVRKSKGERDYLGADEIEKFPVGTITTENFYDCDYMFIPSEKLDAYQVVIRPSKLG